MLLNSSICNFGWKAPDFSLLTPEDNEFGFYKEMGENGLLLAFICNHCPYVIAIAERFSKDMDKLIENGINVLAIMSNDYSYVPADSPENMITFSGKYNFNFPYLIDEDQSIAKTFGAICTPDFFGFNNKGELQYRGRLDNARMGDSSNRNTELLDAMKLVSETGKGPEKQIPSMGCSIKFKD